jgi:hypothetical protein
MRRWIVGLLSGVSAAATAAPEETLRSVPQAVTAISREDLDSLPVGRTLEDLAKVCPARTIPTISPGPIVDGIPTRPGPSIGCAQPDDIRMIEIYKQHNVARAEYGSRPLVWDPLLARGAAAYAGQLTTLGRVHAPREGRRDIRENLLQSLRGQRSPTQMVGVWISERQYFKPGVFPDVSTTGDWSRVGHYTQMIWPTTTAIGCAIHSDAKYDWTVCRYSPPGNRDGTMVNARNQVIAGGGDVAPETSTTVPRIRLDWPRIREGGGMTQIDPPAPPPPPPPTARDPAPEGDEARHPLNTFFNEAFERHAEAVHCDDRAAAEAEMAKMRYAIDELKKRKKAAKKAGRFSTVKPDDVQKQIDELERKLRLAEERRPKGSCPVPPLPPLPPRDSTERG